MVGVQISKRKLYIHIHLDYARVEFISCIFKIKKTFMTFPNQNLKHPKIQSEL